jgi:hypothetical protein
MTQSNQSDIQSSSQSVVPSDLLLRHDGSTASGTIVGGPHGNNGEEFPLGDLDAFMEQFLAGGDLD